MKPLLLLVLLALPLAGQDLPRAVRRTVPVTRSFERALRLGTRDSTGHPGSRYWQLTTDYRIDARLDAVAGRVTGHASITIHNPSDSALKQLVLRLYQNRFNAWAPRSRVPPSLTGGTVLYRLNANGEEVDVKAMATQWATGTVVGLTLANPIPAGGRGTVEVDWAGDIPDVPLGRGAARGGRRALRVFQLAQWYPQVAVYDDLRGWDREPHLGGSEFYNNFGRFEVNLDLPGGYLVGATGTLVNPDEVLAPMVRERLATVLESDSQRVIVGEADRGPSKATRGGSRLVWRFVADTVNDFAWAASADYVWDATRATIPGRGPIPVHLLYLPENTRFRQTGALARHALEFYSALWFPYAFPQFTQVDGPENGMEYPMLTMSGPGFGVTDHEIGHQWWPMMVGTNETWYGWMDEGFNEYMNVLSEAAHQGRAPVLDSLGGSAGAAAGNESQAPMMWNNNYGGPSTTYVTYSKAPMMLSMLGALVGDSAVTRAMRAYAVEWRFRHPSPWDFMFAMNRELGRNLDWFWYSWLFTTESVDGGIERAVDRGRAWDVTVRQRGEMPAPIVLAATLAPGGPPPRLPKGAALRGDTVTVSWPVEAWFDGRRSRTVTLDFGGRRITAVTLDPGARFPDRDRTDNRWPR